MCGFTIRKIAAELAVFDDVRALCGDAFIIVGESAEAGSVFETRVGYDVHDVRAVTQFIELIEGEKARARKIGFLAEDAIEFDGVSDGFVNLQAELASAKNQRSRFLRALGRGM